MSRIPPDESAPIPADATSGVTNMSTLFRVMAHRPQIADSAMRMLATTMREGTVEPELKELLAVRVSQVNHCFY
jgi:alkylhydroperoxidase family enzyme